MSLGFFLILFFKSLFGLKQTKIITGFSVLQEDCEDSYIKDYEMVSVKWALQVSYLSIINIFFKSSVHALTLTYFAAEGRIKCGLNLKLMLKCFVESGSVITIQSLLDNVSLFLCS